MQLEYIESNNEKYIICPKCSHTLMKTPWSYICFECGTRCDLDSELVKHENH